MVGHDTLRGEFRDDFEDHVFTFDGPPENTLGRVHLIALGKDRDENLGIAFEGFAGRQ